MLGFYGIVDGKVVTNAVEFVKLARESYEEIPVDAIGEIMNNLTDEQLMNNLFTKKEIKTLTNLDLYKKVKMYSLERR